MISLFPYFLAGIGTAFILSYGGLSTNQSFSYFEFTKKDIHSRSLTANSRILGLRTFNTPPQQVSITDLLTNGQDYHQLLVSVRGLIIQPELHLDETEMYFDFVFRLSQGTHSIIVYGRHDRTLGPPAIRMNQSVEVIGTFFKEQERNEAMIHNVLESISVVPYPSFIPEST